VKALIFISASVGYAIVAFFIFFLLILQCGLGPDSPVACNDSAETQAFSFAVGAFVFYAILSVGYWRYRSKSEG
jgi:hypothetical protein